MSNLSSNAKYNQITLIFFGEYLNPETLDQLFSIKSNYSYKKGDNISRVNAGKGQRTTGMWSIKGNSQNNNLSDDLDYFISLLNLVDNSKLTLENLQSTRLSIYINDHTKSTLEIQIPFEDLNKIQILGAELYITCFKQIDDN